MKPTGAGVQRASRYQTADTEAAEWRRELRDCGFSVCQRYSECSASAVLNRDAPVDETIAVIVERLGRRAVRNLCGGDIRRAPAKLIGAPAHTPGPSCHTSRMSRHTVRSSASLARSVGG